MNIYSAIGGLRDGQAVKPSNWRGYVKRTDASSSTYQTYDPDRTTDYPAGTSVLYGSNRYINSSAVSPDTDTGKIGEFDSSKWTRVDFDHDLTFFDADDTSPSAVYHANVTLAGVSYVRTGTGPYVDMPDSELFSSILSDTWEMNSAAAYEAQRVGGGGRW